MKTPYLLKIATLLVTIAMVSFSAGRVFSSTSDQRRGHDNVVIGTDNEINGHSNCVLIGNGLKASEDYQVQIGNSKVVASRTLTPAEYAAAQKTLFKTVAWEAVKQGIFK